MPLTRANKAVIDVIAREPLTTQGQAYSRIYGTTDKKQAIERASRLMSKPEAKIYLNKHIEKAKKRIVQLTDSENEQVALKASQDILDREKGKATQRTESVSEKLTIAIDLTKGARAEQLDEPSSRIVADSETTDDLDNFDPMDI